MINNNRVEDDCYVTIVYSENLDWVSASLTAALTAALLTADPLALGTAGVIHAQTLDGKTELLDALSVASLELLSSRAAAFMESVSFKISINNVSVSILSINDVLDSISSIDYVDQFNKVSPFIDDSHSFFSQGPLFFNDFFLKSSARRHSLDLY